jgi:hypothetical protein
MDSSVKLIKAVYRHSFNENRRENSTTDNKEKEVSDFLAGFSNAVWIYHFGAEIKSWVRPA